MELQQLKYFLITAEEEHITHAADILHITQPTLSQSIDRLEKDLGVSLFLRSGRGVKLSYVGEELMRIVKPIISTLDYLPEHLQQTAGIIEETISLNILTASDISTDIILEYKDMIPQSNFNMDRKSDSTNWDLRISATYNDDPTTLPANAAVISHEEIALAVPFNFDIFQRDKIYLREVCDMPFLTYYGSTPYHNMCKNLWNMAGISPRITFESDNLPSVRKLVTAGMGVAFWPKIIWGTTEPDKVHLLTIADQNIGRIIYIQKNPQRRLTRASNEFYEFFLKRFREQIKSVLSQNEF